MDSTTQGTVVVAVLCVLVAAVAVRAAEVKLEDGTRISKSTVVPPGTYRIADAGGDGAILVAGRDITVDFQGAVLDGAAEGQEPNAFTGTGVIVRGRDITLRNLKVRGYKVGVHAIECPNLTVEDLDVSGNYQQRLQSTPEAEDGADWLWPHRNDDHEWTKNYGAGLCVERSDQVTIRRVKARHGQNGIIIDRVNDSKIYDCDCSFLSGWGLAMWRSNRNVITRNAFDFCIRGYSHGVYNRGQDSAGILMFEQNNGNVIAENSVTHGGDGFFGFAGLEALGDKPAPAGFNYQRKGNNDNLLIGNDLSYAAAHGIEMTFSFGNQFIDNRLAGNAICGVWGGYCQDTLVAGNLMENNGEMGYGLERGGVNIDCSRGNRILGNTFRDNRCGVHLWGPASQNFLQKPWAKANHPACVDNVIAGNTFDGDRVVLHLRGEVKSTVFADNRLKGIGREIEAPADVNVDREAAEPVQWERPKYPVFGENRPAGARKELAGRQNILMTEWGPYDFSGPGIFPARAMGSEKVKFRVLGPAGSFKVTSVKGDVSVSPWQGELPGTIAVSSAAPGLHLFSFDVQAGGRTLQAAGTLLNAQWTVQFFKWEAADDPREHQDRWDRLIAGEPVEERTLSGIDFKWGGGLVSEKVGSDHFGTVAVTALKLPAGKYRIWTVSDDGIRVWVDKKRVIDDWTWHPPKENAAEVELSEGTHEIRIEHFEINGVAQLQLRVEPVAE